jgi:hypothetical protein
MSNQREKLFRLFTFMASYCDNPKDLLKNDVSKEELNKPTEESRDRIYYEISVAKGRGVFNSEDELCFEFARKPLENGMDGEDKWSTGCDCVAA